MTSDRLRQVLRARPFQPFRINLADGRGIDIGHPEQVNYERSGRTLSVELPDNRIHLIDLLLVVDLELFPPQPNEP